VTATAENVDDDRLSQVTLGTAPAQGERVTVDYRPTFAAVEANQPVLCTTWSDFVRSFGDFTGETGADADRHRSLAHAVYGFFQNGGSRCYVARVAPPSGSDATDVQPVLDRFEAVDEIALVAAPGLTGGDSDETDAIRAAIVAHCEVRTQDRFAIFDSPQDLEDDDLTRLGAGGDDVPSNSTYAAYYFPWIHVFDPGLRRAVFVPPSGHVAGVYARVDTQRGVHKAPANEVVQGAIGLRYSVSRAQQEGMNPHGVNVIRDLNGNIRIWGARTIGGDDNGEWKYVPIRRLFLFLRESIDQGTQWTVFEPNTTALWAKITLNVSAFLHNVWRDGALAGNTPAEAFYVKCDAETNPPEVRDAGRVVTEIGVAVIKPAEFVIFRISQWAGPGGG
jgi:phage tail sheath protein FI